MSNNQEEPEGGFVGDWLHNPCSEPSLASLDVLLATPLSPIPPTEYGEYHQHGPGAEMRRWTTMVGSKIENTHTQPLFPGFLSPRVLFFRLFTLP